MAGGHGPMAMTIHVLVVAGADSSGGAGLSRDIETVASFGLRSSIAVTAVTVQTHRAVRHIELIEPDIVAAQMRAALECNDVRSIKVGMLGSACTIEAVSSVIALHSDIPVVLDPVLVSSSGRVLLPPEAMDMLLGRLVPQCRLVTPNLPELAMLTGGEVACNEDEILQQATVVLDGVGSTALLIKGGHATGSQATDLLVEKGQPVHRIGAPRLPAEMRGTGCMLASAVAAELALAKPLTASVSKAKQFVFDKLAEVGNPRPLPDEPIFPI